MSHKPSSLIVLLSCLCIARAALPNPASLDISGKAIVEQLTYLAKFTDDPNPAVTRILFTGQTKWNFVRNRWGHFVKAQLGKKLALHFFYRHPCPTRASIQFPSFLFSRVQKMM